MNSQPKYKIGDTVLYHCSEDGKQYRFAIKRVETEDCGEGGVSYLYYDSNPGESGMFLYEEVIDGVYYGCISINDNSLKEQGWEYYSEYGGAITGYRKSVEHNGVTFHIDIHSYSNTVGRNWFAHIDNDRFETVGSMDVSNFGQLDRFLDLLTE